MSDANVWKLQDAKARFSDVVRRARTGEPQHVTVRGAPAVVVVDPNRFDVRPKEPKIQTMAEFIAASKAYRGVTDGIDFEPKRRMRFKRRPALSGET